MDTALRARACAREKSLKNFGPVPPVSSLTLRRYAAGHADGAAGWFGGFDQRDGIIKFFQDY